jgi:hypothetical protein
MWAVGCIFAELMRRVNLFLGTFLFFSRQLRILLFLKEPLLPGETDLNQLVKIFELFGTPNDTNWPVFIAKNLTNKYFKKYRHALQKM